MNIERYSDYFGLWAMHGESFQAAVDRVRGLDLTAHLQTTAPAVAAAAAAPASQLKSDDGHTAIIELSGSLMKFQSSFGGTSTAKARKQLRMAARDPNVSSILLLIDSPGGLTSGTSDLAAEVARAAEVKATWAYIEDTCCSAAYWVASRADQVFSNRTAVVGSIGTYCVLRDSSRAAEQEGYTVHVVRAGDLKGLGEPGAPITPEQLAEIQQMVNSVNSHFLADVQASRKFSAEQLAAVSTGGVWIGEGAKAMGLVDGVQTFEETLAQLRGLGRKPNSRGAKSMSSPSIIELKAACPGASSDFLVAQSEAGATIEAAQRAYMAEQSRKIQSLEKDLTEARAQAQAAEAKATAAEAKAAEAKAETGKTKPGVDPLKTKGGPDDGEGGDPIAAFNTLVDGELNSNRHRNRAAAVAAARKKDPDLHAAYLVAYNAAHASKRKAG